MTPASRLRSATGRLSLTRLALGALVGLAACASTPAPEPLRVPELDARIEHYAGDPIGGPLAREAAAALALDAREALAVTVRLYLTSEWATEWPDTRRSAIGDHVRMIIAGEGSEPLAPGSLVAPGTRLLGGDEALERVESVAHAAPTDAVLVRAFEGLSLPGVTTALRATQVEPLAAPGRHPRDRRLSLELWREDPEDATLSLALVVADEVEVLEGLATAEPEISLRPRSETLVLDARLRQEDGPIVLYVPTRSDPARRLAYVLVLELGQEPTADELAADLGERLAAVREEVRESATASARRRARLDAQERARLRSLRLIEALEDPARQRAALTELAGATGAPLAGELALLADDAFVEDLARRLVEQVEALRERAAEPEALAWLVEREAVRMFVQASAEGEPPPEQTALVLRYTGEAGRIPGALEDALAVCDGTRAFYERMLEENRIALEDPSPAARVRAFDWLEANGVEVPAYDPLADRAARLAALRAWSEAEEEAAEGTRNAAATAPEERR